MISLRNTLVGWGVLSCGIMELTLDWQPDVHIFGTDPTLSAIYTLEG